MKYNDNLKFSDIMITKFMLSVDVYISIDRAAYSG